MFRLVLSGIGIDENGALMITRAKRVLPGMVMTLLLSVPAMAAGAETGNTASTTVEPKVGSASQRSAHGKDVKLSQAPTEKSSQKSGTASKPASERIPASSRAKIREISPDRFQSSNGRIIRRASANGTTGTIDRNLIDDGTLWRERGSLATWQQTGMASWYGGPQWQGQRTTSGSRYDQNELTAAHATLPLGTKVLVTSHSGTRSVVVTINDRPGTRTRIIDLSRQAAKELGILDAGVAMVTLQPM
jgi:rare lipoprotein A (peptidoglycan hydrolase)